MKQEVGFPVNHVIIFDGKCILCNRIIQFIILHDKQNIFRFASLRSHFGQQLLTESMNAEVPVDSVILYSKGLIFMRSQAVIRISKLLGGFYSLAILFQIVPRFARDAIYDFIARRRFRWFGKYDSCIVPGEGISDRFLN